MINCIPKIDYTNKSRLDIDDSHVIFYEKGNSEIVSMILLEKFKELENIDIYRITRKNISILLNDILKSKTKITFPTVFVKFLKLERPFVGKIWFEHDDIFRLQLWSNQLRECNNHEEQFYYAYVIACSILKLSERQSQ